MSIVNPGSPEAGSIADLNTASNAIEQNLFAELGLRAELVRAIHESGYTSPTPIQKAAIPAVLEGHDVMAGAQTGTGKTAGFALPILQRLSEFDFAKSTSKAKIRALILTPTRELAAQVEESVQTYGKYLDLKSNVVFGGVNINQQKQRLNRRVDILVATPGRLLDLYNQKGVDLSGIDILVLDEADRMLDMGFIHDIRRLIALLPKQRQNLLFSATFSDEIKTLAAGILHKPVSIEVARRNAPAESIEQVVHPVDRDKKKALLSHLILTNNWYQVLVFTRTKHLANRLAEQLDAEGISASAIHGNKSQGARTRALAEFKLGYVRVLVATDIAARGIDIDALPIVVNYELPNVPEDYVHRIGRTGRAGAEGKAIALVCVDEHKLLSDIERLVKRKLPNEVVEGFEPDRNAKPQPIRQQHSAPPSHARPKPGQGNRKKTGDSKPGERRSFEGRTAEKGFFEKKSFDKPAGKKPSLDKRPGERDEHCGNAGHAARADKQRPTHNRSSEGNEHRNDREHTARSSEGRPAQRNSNERNKSTGKPFGKWVKRSASR